MSVQRLTILCVQIYRTINKLNPELMNSSFNDNLLILITILQIFHRNNILYATLQIFY